MHYIRHRLLFTFDKEDGIILWFRYKLLFFFFSFYKFRKKNIAAYIALKVMQSTRFLYYIHIGATILATRASFIQTLISVLVTMCRRQNITLFERFHKELLLNDFLNLFQGICKVYAPLPSILHSE